MLSWNISECNRSYGLFLLQVMNMYGELIMESADHKVIHVQDKL